MTLELLDEHGGRCGLLILRSDEIAVRPDSSYVKEWLPLEGGPSNMSDLLVAITYKISSVVQRERASTLTNTDVTLMRHEFLARVSGLRDSLEDVHATELEETMIMAKNTGYVNVASWEGHEHSSTDDDDGDDDGDTISESHDSSSCSTSAALAGRVQLTTSRAAALAAAAGVKRRVSMTAHVPGSENDRFQELQKVIASVHELQGESMRLLRLYEEVHTIARDFADMASNYGHIIISELHLPSSAKSIKPVELGGHLGGQKYLVHNIVFKVPEAALFKDYPDPMWASLKIAGHELKGLKCFSAYQFNLQSDAVRAHLPLAALIDSRGHRLLAMSMLPISSETLCYGSDDVSSECNVVNKDQTMDKIVMETCRFLGLKQHHVVNGIDTETRQQKGEAELMSPVDLEGHKGLDGRYYFIDFARVMPPLWKDDRREHDGNWHYYHLMRCEFLLRYGKPLNPDAFSRFTSMMDSNRVAQTIQDQQDIRDATAYLVTTHMEAACKIMADEWKDGQLHVGSFMLAQRLHFFGINMRFLGKFYDCLSQKHGHEPHVEQLLRWVQCEAMARVGKNAVRSALRRTHQTLHHLGSSDLAATVIHFFGVFVGIIDANIWMDQNEQVLDDLQSMFCFSPENAHRAASTFLNSTVTVAAGQAITARGFVLERICEMTAISIVPEVMSALKHGRVGYKGRTISLALVDVKFGSRVKNLDAVEHAKGFILYQQGLGANDIPTKMSYFSRAHAALVDMLSSPLASIRSLALGGDICLRHLVAASNQLSEGAEVASHLSQQAVYYFESAVAADPHNISAMSSLAELRALLGQTEAARSMFLKALKESERDETTLLKYAHFLKECVHQEVEANAIMERYSNGQAAMTDAVPLFEDEFLEEVGNDFSLSFFFFFFILFFSRLMGRFASRCFPIGKR